MSRALDPKAIAALKTGDHQKISNDIADVFTYNSGGDVDPRQPLIEIEILSGFGFDPTRNILQDDNAVAVPKLRLVQAFFVARSFLLEQKQQIALGKAVNDQALSEQFHRATAVCLLMDAENLTAANTRKRLIVQGLAVARTSATAPASSPSEPGKSASPFIHLLRREKWLLDSLLTSRLHRHTKSPTLWNHRRWLLDLFRLHGLETEVDATREVASIVGVSGERHPRNYYAWNHARWLVRHFHYEAAELVEMAKNWAWQHHTDISGWSFLVFVLNIHRELAPSVYRGTLGLAESLHWRNESVWWFLRTVSAGSMLDVDGKAVADHRAAFVCLGRNLFEGDGRDQSDHAEEERSMWIKAKTWTEKNRDKPKNLP
ncbi:hypothetical protein BROUX41_005184 [Berkeleyomyces rouxiae]|uniref:uncharacterized protein n=1 Tax=Berkeleyomyces rouxiae TaxID=2035830 RepID=UPI003B7C4CCC